MSDSSSDPETRLTQEVTLRAIKRLDLLEWVMMGAAFILSLLGGALAAFFLTDLVPWGFRTLWAVASLLFFVIPTLATFLRVRREEAEVARKLHQSNDKTHG